MRKKTALAMALLHNPRVLLLDEPFEGIDPSSSRLIQETLIAATKRGVTIGLTSHILPLVEKLASRVVILKDATIAWDSEKRVAKDGLTSLEETYFDVVGQPKSEELTWLGS